MDVGSLISGSYTFSKSSLNIWKFSVHVPLKSSLENFDHYFASMWNKCNCVVVWAFFGVSFLWDCIKNTFSSPVATTEFSKFVGRLSAALSQHHYLGFEIAQLEFHYLHYLCSYWCFLRLTGKDWCWGGLGAGGERNDRGWDGWMASLTRWTWVWMKFRSWWWTGRPGVLWFMGSQRVGHDWVTDLNWTD